MHEDTPSMAATLLPGLDLEAAEALVETAMRAQRYFRYDALLPAQYRGFEGEWLGILLRPVKTGNAVTGTLAIPSDVGNAFKLATWLSAADPDRLLLAWRRFQGFEGVCKYLFDGKPQWKHGRDKDMEVGWHVPAEPPVTLKLPAHDDGFPFDAAGAEALFVDVEPFPMEPLPTNPDDGFGRRLVSYIHNTSKLHA